MTMTPKLFTWRVKRRVVLLVFLILMIFTCTICVFTRHVFTDVMKSIQFSGYFGLSETEPNYIPLKFKVSKHLSPYTSITQRMAYADPPLNRTQINEIYQTGAGLEKIFVNGVPTWREYGVTYVPRNTTNITKSTLANVIPSEYEPYIAYDPNVFFEGRDHKPVPESERKIIMVRFMMNPDVNDLQPLKVCPDFPCVQTTNGDKYFDNASAVTFNGLFMSGNPPAKRPGQLFIFYNHERFEPSWSWNKPFLNRDYGWSDVFNWTMSPHMDADIFLPYALVRKRPTPIYKDYNATLAKKEKLAAIFVSHCDSHGKREEYVKQMQQYIPVDVYGWCGPFKCEREKDADCFQDVNKKYKFYLAFENAICEDYVTEKLFKNLQLDTVMVVRGGDSYYKYMPDDIYINTADFKSAKDLAERLQYLDKHDEEYVKILQRKDEYFAAYEDYPHWAGNEIYIKYIWENVPLCEICQKLWNLDLYGNMYTDIAKWFNERLCTEPKDI